MNYQELMTRIGMANRLYASGNTASMQAAVANRERAIAEYNAAQTRSSGSGPAPSPPAPTPAPPPPTPPPPPPPYANTDAVKPPDGSRVQYNPQILPQELITDLLYEDVGGTELINIARHDTINGQEVVHSLVRNLSVLNQTFNPNNILAVQAVYSSYLNQYALDIASKIDENSIYLDVDGNLVVEFSSINGDEYAEVEISTDGTIYKIGV